MAEVLAQAAQASVGKEQERAGARVPEARATCTEADMRQVSKVEVVGPTPLGTTTDNITKEVQLTTTRQHREATSRL